MKEIKNYENYTINECGDIWSKKSKKYLKQQNRNGYKSVSLYNIKGGMKTFYVHRLVAENFIKNEHNKKCVNHINYNKHDNRACNLEWVTYSENEMHKHYGNSDIILEGTNGKTVTIEKGIRKRHYKYDAHYGNKYLGMFKTLEEARLARNNERNKK